MRCEQVAGTWRLSTDHPCEWLFVQATLMCLTPDDFENLD